jgi:hypothetical protein
LRPLWRRERRATECRARGAACSRTTGSVRRPRVESVHCRVQTLVPTATASSPSSSLAAETSAPQLHPFVDWGATQRRVASTPNSSGRRRRINSVRRPTASGTPDCRAHRRAVAGRRSPRRPSRGPSSAPRGRLRCAPSDPLPLMQSAWPLNQRFGAEGSDRLVSRGRPAPSSQGAACWWHRSRTRLGPRRAGTWRRSRPAVCRRRSSQPTTRGSPAQASR